MTAAITELATKYGRYGYRRITALLGQAGWSVNSKRVERIWRQEGLKVPAKQPKRERLWLGDGSCLRLRPERKDHVWAYDFVADRTADGKAFRLLTVVDEYTRECLAIRVERKLGSTQALEKAVADFSIRVPNLSAKVSSLSGGNQQKLVLAKTMEATPDILILDEPTRGIDVGTKRQIYFFIQTLLEEGKSCILISSELPEIVGLCHRVVVMRSGVQMGTLEGTTSAKTRSSATPPV